jgi:site-specific recombinase XerD
MGYNLALRRMAQRAGITERVKVFKAGEHKKGEKWEYLSSHSARISFCTNLVNLGVPLIEVASMMGHASVSQTERYYVKTQIELSNKALKYFQ